MNPQVILAIVILNLLVLVSAFGKTASHSTKSTKQVVTFASPCVCKNDHHQDRWTAKTDPAPLPDKSQIAPITPSQIYQWPGVAGLTTQSKRIASEQRWFALTGKVADVRVEGDGDLHVELVDANDNKTGIVGAEIPPGQHWCKLRSLVFSWTTAAFPFNFPTKSKLMLRENHVITVMGKAFYDVDHAPKNHSNQRPKPFAAGYAVWEIHPVTGLRVEQ